MYVKVWKKCRSRKNATEGVCLLQEEGVSSLLWTCNGAVAAFRSDVRSTGCPVKSITGMPLFYPTLIPLYNIKGWVQHPPNCMFGV